MTKVEQLTQLGIIGDIRQRNGVDADDAAEDENINKMTNDGILKAYAGWHLGDPYWWTIFKNQFDALERMDKLTK